MKYANLTLKSLLEANVEYTPFEKRILKGLQDNSKRRHQGYVEDLVYQVLVADFGFMPILPQDERNLPAQNERKLIASLSLPMAVSREREPMRPGTTEQSRIALYRIPGGLLAIINSVGHYIRNLRVGESQDGTR